MRRESEAAFDEFVAATGQRPLRTAYLLTGDHNRVQQAASVTAVAAVVGAGVSGGMWAHDRSRTGGNGSAARGTAALPSASSTSCYDTAKPVLPGSAAPSVGPTPLSPLPSRSATSSADGAASAAIRAVSLPDPAPGFPVRRGSDGVTATGIGNGAYWTATFLVAMRPGATKTMAPGAVDVAPMGPEASVLVSDGHPFALSPSVISIEGIPVSGTTTVDGHTAYITRTCDQTDIYFSTGRFDVLLAGFGTTDQQLVTLGDALKGLQ